jgi:hypothetical protein
MNGYATQLALYRENGILGAQTGVCVRPAGIAIVTARAVVATTWNRTDPLFAVSEDEVVHQAWSLRLRREVKHSAIDLIWLNALTDGTLTTAGDDTSAAWIDNVTPPTHVVEVVMQDGTQRRFRGCALRSLEWLCEAGRVVAEEVELIALRNEPFTGSITSQASQGFAAAATGMSSTAYFKIGTAWTGANPFSDPIRSIMSQLIWTRGIEAAGYNADGLPTVFATSGGWEFVGRNRFLWTQWPELLNTKAAKAAWKITAGSDFLLIEADVKAKVSAQTLLASGPLDSMMDWLAYRRSRSLFSITKHSQT